MINKVLNLKALAKINLTLDILGKREDGFHEVRMIMQSIDLGDELTLTTLDAGGIVLEGAVKGVAKPEDNLVYKAASLFAKHYNLDLNVKINLQKKIPVAAGLAGGSADAGAVLLGLNELMGINDSLENLMILGGQLGSDIPFTMRGGTMLATGRGEILQPLVSNLQAGLVLIKPPVGIATPWAYGKYQEYATRLVHPKEDKMLKALANGDLDQVIKAQCNVFEQIMVEELPIIEEIKESLDSLGYKSLMSGSGPTVYSLVKDRAEAEKLASSMAAIFPDCEVFATTLVNR